MSTQQSNLITRDKAIQMQQKLLHYRSEVVKYTRLVEKQETKLKAQQDTINSLLSKLNQKQDQDTAKQEDTSLELELTLQPYFNYSLIVPDLTAGDEAIIIKGTFIIRNISKKTLNHPVICLAFNHANVASLSGKFAFDPSKSLDEFVVEDERVNEMWVYAKEDSRKTAKVTGQHWLKPQHTHELAGNETLSLSNFDIVVPVNTEKKALIINGYVYGEQIPNGQESFNSIIINL